MGHSKEKAEDGLGEQEGRGCVSRDFEGTGECPALGMGLGDRRGIWRVKLLS